MGVTLRVDYRTTPETQQGLRRGGRSVLEIAARTVARAEVAGAHVGPGAAAVLPLAGGLAGGTVRVGLDVEIAVVAAEPVDAELKGAVAPLARLLHPGALDAGDAARILHPLRHLVFQPANRILPGRAGIDEAPGTTAAFAIAPRGARRRVGRPFGHAGVIPAGTVKAGLAGGGKARAQQDMSAEQVRTKKRRIIRCQDRVNAWRAVAPYVSPVAY